MYSKVTLCADIMYVNGVQFLVTISRHIKHITVVPTKKMNQTIMLSCVDKVVKAYAHQGFTVTNILMDN